MFDHVPTGTTTTVAAVTEAATGCVVGLAVAGPAGLPLGCAGGALAAVSSLISP